MSDDEGRSKCVKDHTEPSVFRPEHLLREARRQRNLPDRDVPAVCVLDPDGDLFRHARLSGRASLSPGWACYHTELYELQLADGTAVGILGNAVGAPFAVLVAEQLFASGCRFLISITSSGKIADLGEPPYVVLIDRALRDEGTSFHYLPPGSDDFVTAPDAELVDRVEAAVRDEFPSGSGTAVHRGATWTTDAPYRETGIGYRGGGFPRCPRGRDGGRGAVCLRDRARCLRDVFRPCHQQHGSERRRRFRKRRGGRYRYGPAADPCDCRGVRARRAADGGKGLRL